MAASDEFPRGWDFVQDLRNSTSAPNIIVPATIDIAHVLTAVNFSVFGGGAASMVGEINAVFTPGGSYSLGLMSLVTGSNDVAAINWAGSITGPISAQLNVEFSLISGGGSGYDWLLEAQGFDI